jgi:hypothetical protein
MGKFIESHPGSGDWHIISGGKPNADWTGIDAQAPKSAYVPTQIRGSKSKYAAIEYEKRIQGPKTKYKEGRRTWTLGGSFSCWDKHPLKPPPGHQQMASFMTRHSQSMPT